MDFCYLQERLLGNLKSRVRSGETTERHLARSTGVSQPHIHNVLKGFRELTPATADRILRALRMNILDLIEPHEIGRYLQFRLPADVATREIPVLAGTLGNRGQWPLTESTFERFNLPVGREGQLVRPVAARLAPDPEMSGIFSGGELIIVELMLKKEWNPDPRALYIVEQDQEVNVRWVRMGQRHLYVLNAINAQTPDQWPKFELEAASMSRIKGRVMLHAFPSPDHHRAAVPRRPPGISPTPAPRSVAS